WMQHPVGYTIDQQTGQAQLSNIWQVMSNPVFIWGYIHVLLASLVTGTVVMLAVSAWHLRRNSETAIFHKTATLSLIILAPAALFAVMIGSWLGVVETTYQPMKIAAAEAQWTTCQPCSFSLFQVGGGNNDETPTKIIAIPHLLSVLATNSWNGQVVGLNELNAQYQQQYGPGYYVPNVFIQSWSMRVMAFLGSLVLLLAVVGLWLLWKKRLDTTRWFLWLATWAVVTPFLMNTAGWMLTENGRQPWIVQGLQQVKQGVSPSVGATTIAISLGVFVLLYAVLAVVEGTLMIRYSRKQLDPVPQMDEHGEPVPAMTY